MKAVVCAFGTSGDVIPLLCLAKALQKEGGDVICVLNPSEEDLAGVYGLRYMPAGKYFDMNSFISGHPELSRAEGTSVYIDKAVLPQVESQYNTIKDVVADMHPDVIVSHFLCFGSEWGANEQAIKHVTVLLSPITLFSMDDPSTSVWQFKYLPKFVKSMLIRLGKRLFRSGIDKNLELIAKKISAQSNGKKYFESKEQSCMQLALWSHKYRGHARDDDRKLKICGFVYPYDINQQITKATETFLVTNRAPVIVGFGSSVRNLGRGVYEMIAAACSQLELPCLMIGMKDTALERRYSNLHTTYFEPYEKVFALGSVIIHHGGISTMAAAFRAGQPALIIPFMFDQFDNAVRSKNLGVARILNHANVTQRRIMLEVKKILEDRILKEKASLLREDLLEEENGADVAARDIIEMTMAIESVDKELS